MASAKGVLDGHPSVISDESVLAPKFRAALDTALAECHQDPDLDVMVYETQRTNELQDLYYQLGRTQVPPHQPVTNVQTADHGWHFFGLAVDVISQSRRWDVPDAWYQKVAVIFKKHGLDWGGDWVHIKDLPHFQWGQCKPSPSDLSRQLYADGGVEKVWEAVGAAA